MSENKGNYKEYVEAFDNLQKALKQAEAINSQDLDARRNAREFAIKHAGKSMPGLEKIAENPILRAEVLKSPSSLDEILANAVETYSFLSGKRFQEGYKLIIEETPEKGLAAIVYDIPAMEIKGNDMHNEAAEIHGNYSAFKKILSKVEKEGESMNAHAELQKAAVAYVANELAQKFAKDKDLKGETPLIESTIKAVSAILAGSLVASKIAVENAAKAMRKRFEEKLPDEKSRAAYARENLLELAGNEETMGIAMQLVYAAHKKSK